MTKMSENSGKKMYGAVNADCLDVMKRMSDNSIDAIVTDPPYGISFMSKGFDTFKKEGMTDNQAFQADMTPLFREMLRVAKPGAHLLAFGGTRTYHRLTCAIEDVGWEVRDCLGWIYSSGMPKSMDIDHILEIGREFQMSDTWRGATYDTAKLLCDTIEMLRNKVKNEENKQHDDD